MYPATTATPRNTSGSRLRAARHHRHHRLRAARTGRRRLRRTAQSRRASSKPGNRSAPSNRSKPSAKSMPGLRRSHRGQRRALRHARNNQSTTRTASGWLIKMKLANPSEATALMDAAAYRLTSPKERNPRPDALSPQEPIRTPGNARCHRRALRRRSFRVHPRAVPPARSAATARPALGSRDHRIFPRSARPKIRAATPVFLARASTTICARWSPTRSSSAANSSLPTRPIRRKSARARCRPSSNFKR